MGAWGFGLFQSDHDYDRIGEFSEATGVNKLQEDLRTRLKSDPAIKAKYVRPAGDRSAEDPRKTDEEQLYLSVYDSFCSTAAGIELVRNHLEDGALASFVENFATTGSKHESDCNGYSRKGYEYVLFGACTMMLGCKLPESFKEGLKEKYDTVGLMADAKKQMCKALYARDGYVEGESYAFGSLGLHDIMSTLTSEDVTARGGTINVEEPGNPFSSPEAKAVMRKAMQEAMKKTGSGGGGGGATTSKKQKAA